MLSYVDGMEVNDYCCSTRVTRNPLGACRSLGFYLSNTLGVFHRKARFGKWELQFIYQDLKPANILVSRSEGLYCLIDFGSFAVIGPNGVSNGGISTTGYAAPELAKLDFSSACQPRLDVYSLGIVLKEFLQRAGGSQSPQLDISAAQLDIPAPWQSFLDHCTATDPDRRYQTMGDVARTLAQLEF